MISQEYIKGVKCSAAIRIAPPFVIKGNKLTLSVLKMKIIIIY